MSLSSILESRRSTPSLLRRFLRVLALWRENARGRRMLRELGTLDDNALKDIGINRSQLIFESSKFFWEQ